MSSTSAEPGGRPLPAPPAWTDQARCAETDPEAFFPEKGGSTKAAKAVCSQCPVRAECLTYALDNDERFGVWGGVSERGRRRLQGQPDDTGACGTYPKGYGRHRKRGERPCDECRRAANTYAQLRRAGTTTPVDLRKDEAS